MFAPTRRFVSIRRGRNLRRGQTGFRVRTIVPQFLVLTATLAAGCTSMNLGKPLFGPRGSSADTTPVPRSEASSGEGISEPAADSQPVEAAPDPQDQIAEQVEQYVANLPIDDLHAKLARHQPAGPEGESDAGGPAASVSTPESASTAVEAAAGADRSADETIASQARPVPNASKHVPLEPEIVISGSSQSSRSRSASGRAAAAAPVAVDMPTEDVTAGDTRIVEIEISPTALAAVPSAAAADGAGNGAARPNRSAGLDANVGSSAGDLRDLIGQLRREARERPDSLGAALRLRVAEWSLAGRDASPAEWSLQDAEKRRLAESIWQVLQAATGMDGPGTQADAERFQQALESLDEMLRRAQPLRIPKAALCWSVQNYGNYEALPEPWRFEAGRKNMVVLYCELAGFRSEEHPDRPGWYRTLLGERLAILTPDGTELWNYQDQEIEDVCRRPRRDFFVPKVLSIPGNLPVGEYVLKVTIRDRIANRVTEANLPFAIVQE